MSAMRVLGIVSLLSLMALAGCAAPSASLEQSGLSLANGKDSKSLDCSSGKGSLDYTVSGSMGGVKISVRDKNDGKVVEKDGVSGSASGSMSDLSGAPGNWILTVDRSGFSGSYRVTLKC